MKRYFKCEIKTASRWQQVTINIVTEPNHLNGWFIQEQNTVKLLRDAKLFCGGCLELFLVGEIEQKQAIWCLKHKSLNINLLFIELLYEISITFVIMLIFKEKNGTLHVILTISNDILVNMYIFCPHILNFVIFLNAF